MDKLNKQKLRLKFIFPILILISISVGWAIYDFTFIKRYISFIYAGSDPHVIGLGWYNPRFVISKHNPEGTLYEPVLEIDENTKLENNNLLFEKIANLHFKMVVRHFSFQDLVKLSMSVTKMTHLEKR